MYDLAIIGAGAGGIACAKSALKAGLKILLVDRSFDLFGGTCINRGCIPTKFFLNNIKHGKQWEDIFSSKAQLIDKIRLPLLKHLTTQGVDMMWGQASFVDKHKLIIADQYIEAKNFIIAAGSSPRMLASGPKIVSAEDIFSLPKIPSKILIVGGGYIGIEMASLLHVCGCDITVVEKEERILPGFDQRIVNRFRIILETKGIKIDTGRSYTDYNLNDYGLILMAVGRIPDIQHLQLNNCGVDLDARGWVVTDKRMRTTSDNIYACGDVTGKKMLAYTAEYQAHLCINNITRSMTTPFAEEDYNGLAQCVFSFPQLAHTGISEDEAKAANIKYTVLRTNFLKFSSAYVYDDTDGYMQIILDENRLIIGADIISNHAGELISVLAEAVANKVPADALARCLFVHPTLSEIIPLALRMDS